MHRYVITYVIKLIGIVVGIVVVVVEHLMCLIVYYPLVWTT